LVADGFNLAEVQTIRALLGVAKATVFLIGPRRGMIYSTGGVVGTGDGLVADHHFEGQRSTMFDAVLIPSGEEHAKSLAENGRVIHWVREAFGHCKTIGAVAEGVTVVKRALELPVVKLQDSLTSGEVVTSYGVVTTGVYTITSTVVDVLKIKPGPTGFVSNFAYQISKHRCYDRELDGLTTRVAY
jgi:catalase